MLPPRADTVFTGGKFITMEEDAPIAQAVAVGGGRFLSVGSLEEAMKYAVEGTEIVDLGGKTVIPGLIESHAHPCYYGDQCATINLSGEATSSKENVLKKVAAAAAKTPKGTWLFGWGWDEAKFKEGALPVTAADLDTVSPNNPVFIKRTCGHVGAVNTLAMRLCGITADAVPPVGGKIFKDDKGEPTGVISGAVQHWIPFPKPTDEQIMELIATDIQDEIFRKGITTTTEMAAEARFVRIYQQLQKQGRLKMRIRFYTFARSNVNCPATLAETVKVGLMSGFGNDTLRFAGMKYLLDGSTGGKTAAFSVPYVGEPDNFGTLYNDQGELCADMLLTAQGGMQASLHAIGDVAIEQALKGVEYCLAHGVDVAPLRFRFEHVESPTVDQIERMKKYGILVGTSAGFIYALGDSHYNVMGPERVQWAFPNKEYVDRGMVFACNNDCPVCDINPMLGIYSMVCRKTQGGKSFGTAQHIDRMQALKAYTVNAAKMLFDEDIAGSMKAGKYADMVVLNQDYLAVPDEDLGKITVDTTYLAGEAVYKA
ncbi:MAG TPA: amidohydrolase [Candidatus Acidoferrum sp.]|nr:amidohydrolase [Candidatus Acidoferrum sp.]